MGADLGAVIDLEEETKIGDPEKAEDDPIYSHIIERQEDKTAPEIILEAMVNGTPVTALCGYVWVPSRDPEKHPPCPKCIEIYEFAKDMRS